MPPWFYFCLSFLLLLAAALIVPIAQHPTLPRKRKWGLSSLLFLVLVPGGLALYSLLGVPPMASL